MKNALQNASPEDMQRVKDMLADLNSMLEADARGEDTEQQFADFMAKHGEFFPENPQTLEELTDALARRASAAERLMRSLSQEQRQELADLMSTAMEDLGLQSEMSRLSEALRGAPPGLDWGGQRAGGSRERMTGDEPLGLGEATDALQELAELDELAGALNQDYPGASLEDVDADAVARAVGRSGGAGLKALQELERELERQGYLSRRNGQLELTPRAVRRVRAGARVRGVNDPRAP